MTLKRPVCKHFPPPEEIRYALVDALRDVELLRSLLRLAERAERYRERDLEFEHESESRGRQAAGPRKGGRP
jgi:hypothetical protein